MCKPDIDPEDWSDERLADYINDTAETAAALGDDDGGAAILKANVKAAIDEFRARNGDNDQELTVDTVVDAEVGADVDHYLRHVSDVNSDYRIRHDRAIQTRVDDGHVVHVVFESVADDAHPDAVSWSRSYFTSCKACGADLGDPEADNGDTYVQTWSCPECPWQVRRAPTSFPSGVGDDPAKPLWSRTTHPHDFDDDVDPGDVPPIKTGKQGRRDMGQGRGGRPGTGLRRPHGFAHNNRYFRTVLRDAEDTGLIARVGDDDADVDTEGLRWEATDKGRRVFDDLSRCRTCGDKRVPMLRTSHYNVGRKTKTDRTLTTACPTCDDLRSGSDGALVLESSGSDWSLSDLPGVAYDDV
jgi:hypothetical protein